jgi:hypothetical protein
MPNAQVKPTRVAEKTAWQAVPAMLIVERHEFGLNAMLGLVAIERGRFGHCIGSGQEQVLQFAGTVLALQLL